MIPGATLALAAIIQQVRAEMPESHDKRCALCVDMVYVTFFNWLQRQRGAKR